ncbi:YdbH domain-containing protein [Microbulbifer sp. SSSA007]|uniref:intermembrane phospholipid transport protein YdbH family protein n=1 Tax=Microbulbifer sp. SSSA007 TaxID=3243379 RepID=UPI004039609B
MLLFGSWWKKDIVAPQLINLFSGEVVIKQLSGLSISFREVSIERIQLTSTSGKNLTLDNVQVLYPFHVLISRDNIQRIELSVDKLTHQESKPDTQNPTSHLLAEENIFSLEKIARDITQNIPGKVLVKEIEINNSFIAGPLSIVREDSNILAELPYKTIGFDNYHISLELDLTPDKISVNASITPDSSELISYTTLSISKEGSNYWQLDGEATSNLEVITPIIRATRLLNLFPESEIDSSGRLTVNANALIPDNIFSLSDYQNINLQVKSKSLEISGFDDKSIINTTARLSTTTPIEIEFKSFSPLLLEYITGSGAFEVSSKHDNEADKPLLNLKFESATDEAQSPKLHAEGSAYLDAAEPILQSLHRKIFAPSFTVTNLGGKLKFQSEIFFKPVNSTSAWQSWLERIGINFLPGSEIHLNTSISNQEKNSLLKSTGLDQSQADVEIVDTVQLILEPSATNTFAASISNGGVNSKLQASGSTTSAVLQIRQLNCSYNRISECDFNLDLMAPTIINKTINTVVKELHSSAKVKIQTDGDIRKVKLEQINTTFEEITGGEFKLKKGVIQQPLMNCEIKTLSTSCISPKWKNQLDAFNSESISLSGDLVLSDFNLKTTKRNTELSANFSSKNLKVITPENYSMTPTLTGVFSLNGDKIEGKSQLNAGALRLDSNWYHNIEQATGNIHFSLPEVEFTTNNPLSKAVQGLPLDIVSGAFSANGNVSWPLQPKNSFKLILTNIAAVYGESFATGVEGTILLENDEEHWFTPKPQPLSIRSINAGLTLDKVLFSLSLDREQDLSLRDFSAEFLDGELRSEALTWNLADKTRSSILSAKNVSLEQLAQETESENFEAGGHLDLVIPIITGPDGITVKHGHLEAVEPGGRLRYYGAFSPQILSGNPQLKLIANALEDYDFRTLEGSMEYPPSGDLQLSLKLVGRSDSVDSERDLIINLNLENNIPAMLRSLQASRDLTEALEKQLDQ